MKWGQTAAHGSLPQAGRCDDRALERFHLVGVANGGFVALDYAA